MRRTIFRATAVVVFSIAAAAAGAYAQQPPADATPAIAKVDAPAGQASSPSLQQRYPRYIIQREDSLLLTFPVSTELNQTVTVQPDGFINLQVAGSLHVQGMTVPEVTQAIQQAYGHILHNPIINVDLADFQKPMFTVSGQVGKPGQYELRSDLTVAEALAVAGGMVMTSAKTQVYLFHRTSHDWYEVKRVNLKEILRGKKLDEDAMVQPGDMIYVPEKFITNFRKYVPYSATTGTFVQPN
ncbi:polysaccharide export outer membrane protein [Silvibacterium bohemicum]|uniref:Polysaccharide export outer membrane protein n=1 Tax=Silvibacterium bohemicum TaxID=1577686 RepID=A0A841K1Z2_9BACT|nr:polysaccharide biosynthesis/export family protein [Silvibacterium bohemicum]MBB6145191.1 polysaccharide export outer membrane protein [Silvibacterium bohemicum]